MIPRDYSDEELNAFVDDEMTEDEHLELLQAASGNDALRRRLTDMQLLKAQTRVAFPPPEGTLRQRAPNRTGAFPRNLAAAALGALTLAGLLSLNDSRLLQTSKLQEHATSPMQQVSDMSRARVLFHISSDRKEDAEHLLDQVELVLQTYQQSGRPLRVEVVANSLGLRLLQQGQSPFPGRIQQLHATYPNLVFAACGNTLERLARKDGKPIDILPEAVIIRSGVSSISRRQQTGWAYIKV